MRNGNVWSWSVKDMMADFGNIIDVLNEAVFEEGKSIGVIFYTRINFPSLTPGENIQIMKKW